MKILVAVLLAVAAAAPIRADEPAKVSEPKKSSNWDTLRTWFQHFKQGLESSGAERSYQRKNISITAVAAVRGNGQKLEDPNKPYIKGRLDAKNDAMLKKERAELDDAVALVLAGKPDEGVSKLDAFVAANPKSPYSQDAKAAIDKAKQLKAEQTPSPSSASATPGATANP